jgi:fumarate reductase subunit D
MIRFPGSRISSVATAVSRRLEHLVRELAPVMFFFFAAFGILFLMFKLFAEQYSIEISAFAKAAVGAVILGKIVALMDVAQSHYRFGRHRGAVVIGIKTLAYGFAVLLFGIAERIFEFSRKAGSLDRGYTKFIAQVNVYRMLAMVLLITVMIGLYLLAQEIECGFGPYALRRLLFDLPQHKPSVTRR